MLQHQKKREKRDDEDYNRKKALNVQQLEALCLSRPLAIELSSLALGMRQEAVGLSLNEERAKTGA
jgi:hypothetical protein